ncbi:MAG: hypothetical protein KDI60_12985 [Xanthomonadales bacterium]|nr:hypothetical protein [Xanthomonadales bacterium]MCP5476092.1 hypothetical protein [Rhodanobacteraceae bacterium]
MMSTRLRLYLFGLLATLPLHSAAESIRLAPPQAMFKQSTTLNQFVSGTLRFVMLHELGHGLVDLYQIPVLGREEDAADRFATWWMSPDGAENGTDAVAAVEWWMASGQQSGLKREQLPWWDEHGMDEQRGFQIACLLYGADPQIMEPLAARVGLPPERREKCIAEADSNAASWSAYLRAQAVTQAQQFDGFLAPVNYLQPESVRTISAAARARELKLLEQLQGLLRQFKYPQGKPVVRLVAQDCGKANAFWSSDERAIVLCYELIDHVNDVGKAAGFR